MIDWKETNAPSVDAGKETFSRKDVIDFVEWVELCDYTQIPNGNWMHVITLEDITTSQLLDEYLNQLNKKA